MHRSGEIRARGTWDQGDRVEVAYTTIHSLLKPDFHWELLRHTFENRTAFCFVLRALEACRATCEVGMSVTHRCIAGLPNLCLSGASQLETLPYFRRGLCPFSSDVAMVCPWSAPIAWMHMKARRNYYGMKISKIIGRVYNELRKL